MPIEFSVEESEAVNSDVALMEQVERITKEIGSALRLHDISREVQMELGEKTADLCILFFQRGVAFAKEDK